MNERAARLADVKSLVDETRSRRSASGIETVTVPLLAEAKDGGEKKFGRCRMCHSALECRAVNQPDNLFSMEGT
jgi:cytochrome c2